MRAHGCEETKRGRRRTRGEGPLGEFATTVSELELRLRVSAAREVRASPSPARLRVIGAITMRLRSCRSPIRTPSKSEVSPAPDAGAKTGTMGAETEA